MFRVYTESEPFGREFILDTEDIDEALASIKRLIVTAEDLDDGVERFIGVVTNFWDDQADHDLDEEMSE